MKKVFFVLLIIVFCFNFNSTELFGQVNISAGQTITENFSIGTSATATLPSGWKVDKNTNVRTLGNYALAGTATEQIAGNNMASNAPNGIYNFAAGDATSATDRAVGGISSGSASKSVNIYVMLNNNGSQTINDFTISYNVEKYRNGSNPAGFSIQMYYSTNDSTWTSAGSDFLTSFAADANNNGYTSAPGTTIAVNNKTLNVQLNPGNNLYLAWNYSVTSGNTTSNAQALGIDDVTIKANSSATLPYITVSTTSLSGFSYSQGYGPSAEQSFSVSGTDLTGNITITPPTNYEISFTSGSGFVSSPGTLTLTPSGGNVPNTTIYVRLKAGLSAGNYNSENVVCSSSGATSQNVSCSGTVSIWCYEISFDNDAKWTPGSTALTSYASDHVYSEGVLTATGGPALRNTTSTQDGYPGAIGTYSWRLMDEAGVSWVATIASGGVGDFEIDLRRWDASPSPNYILSYSIDGGNNWTIVSTINNTTLDNSSAWKTFSGTINSGNNNIKIRLTSSGITERIMVDNLKWTCYVENCETPTINVSSLSTTSVTGNSAEVSFTKGNGTYTLVLAKMGSPVDAIPSDNTTYNAGPYGDGDEIGTGNFVVYSGNGNTFNLSGLTGGTTYYLKAFSYNCSSGNELYYTGGSPATHNFTTLVSPVTNLKVVCTDNNSAVISWTNPLGNFDGVIIGMRQNTLAPHSLSADPSTLNANSIFGSGTSYGADNTSFVVYKGTGNSVTVTNLVAGETYSIKAYAYSGTLYSSTQPTTTISNLGVPKVSNVIHNDADQKSSISWTNPASGCYDEILVIARQGASVTSIPTGDGSGYSANSVFGYGTQINAGEYVCYKGTSNNFLLTGLTNGQTYYVKIFVRVGMSWSEGVEILLNPIAITLLEYGDLAVLAVNTNGTVGDEFTVVSFVDILPNTAIDFTDNGYERMYEGFWGNTEGVLRFARQNSVLSAGKVITFEVIGNVINPVLDSNCNVYVDGLLDNSNWTVQGIGGSGIGGFNFNDSDQLWVMQGGSWLPGTVGNHDAIYTGNVLYGWTAIGWQSAPGYNSTAGSTIVAEAQCATTNIVGLTNKSKVKYSGSFDPTNRIGWITRINDPANWTGYADNSAYDAAIPKYKQDGQTISIESGGLIAGTWGGLKSSDWCNCANWLGLKVPDEYTDVFVPATNQGNDLVLNNCSTDKICKSLTIQGQIYNQANAVLDIKENLILQGGIVNFDLNSIQIKIGGDLIVDDNTNFNADSLEIIFNGISDQNVFSGINGNLFINKITLDKNSGNLILDDDIEVSYLNFINGVLSTGFNRIFVSNPETFAISGFSESAYITGNLRRAVNSTGNYSFPVGISGIFERADVEIMNSDNLNYIDASFNHIDPSELDISSLGLYVNGDLLQTVLNGGYWTLTPNSGINSVNYNIGLYLRGSSNAGNEPGQHSIIKRQNSSSDWVIRGIHNNATQSIAGGTVYAYRSNLDEFSDFAIAKNNDNILPVEFLYLEIECENNANILKWATASEKNSDYFEVQSSSNTNKWTTLTKVSAAGNSNSTVEYSYKVDSKNSNITYYRLKQVDFDGSVLFSKIVSSKCNQNESPEIIIYPVPADEFVNIVLNNWKNDQVVIEIFGADYKLINKYVFDLSNSNEIFTIDISYLKSGIYSLRLTDNQNVYLRRIVKH